MDDQSCPWMPACLTAVLRQRISGLPQDEQQAVMAFQAAFSAIAFEIQAIFNTDRDCGRIRYALGCQTLADLSLALNIQFEPLNPQVIVDALNSRAHTHGIRCLLLVSLMPVLPEPLLANGMVIAGELSDIFQELRQFEVTIRFLQALLKKTDGLQPDLNALFPVLIRLCRYGRQNLQSAQALTTFMQATGLRLTDLEQMEDHRTACRFVQNCFSGLTQENLVDLLTALANCLIDTGGATLATKLLLAAIGLNPKDLYGLHSSEGNMGLLYEAHRQSPAQFVTELIRNHFKGNPTAGRSTTRIPKSARRQSEAAAAAFQSDGGGLSQANKSKTLAGCRSTAGSEAYSVLVCCREVIAVQRTSIAGVECRCRQLIRAR